MEELYRLLQSSGVRVRTEDMIQVEDLHEHQGLYEEQVKEAREFVESKLSEMNAVVDGNIARLNEQVMRCKNCAPEGSLHLNCFHFHHRWHKLFPNFAQETSSMQMGMTTQMLFWKSLRPSSISLKMWKLCQNNILLIRWVRVCIYILYTAIFEYPPHMLQELFGVAAYNYKELAR